MQLRDMLITELLFLTSIRPAYEKAVRNRHQDFLIRGDEESFSDYMQVTLDLARREAVIETLTRILKEYDEQV